MPRRIVIIQGHPDAKAPHLCDALATEYEAGARAGGHTVSRFDLARIRFPLLGSEEEFEHKAVPESLRPAMAAIEAADHIVFVFPLWLGTMPALVKGFLEQVLRPGEAFAYREHGFPQKLLAGKTGRIIVTMGMPVPVYRWWYGGFGLRGLERSVLYFVGIRPVRESLFGMVTAVSPARRKRWLARMRRLGQKAA